MDYADDLQAVSVDEALVDITSYVARVRTDAPRSGKASSDPAKDTAEKIRAQVKEVTACEG